MEEITQKGDADELRAMIEEHVRETGSRKGQEILEQFTKYLSKFKKIIPNDYKKMLTLSRKYEAMGFDREEAQIEAFYESVGQKRQEG